MMTMTIMLTMISSILVASTKCVRRDSVRNATHLLALYHGAPCLLETLCRRRDLCFNQSSSYHIILSSDRTMARRGRFVFLYS